MREAIPGNRGGDGGGGARGGRGGKGVEEDCSSCWVPRARVAGELGESVCSSAPESPRPQRPNSWGIDFLLGGH